MKLCVSSTGKKLASLVDPRFGRCAHFVILDTATQQVDVISNPSASISRGAGVGAAQKIVDEGCEVVISGNMGPNAFHVLRSAGVKIYEAGDVTVEQALKQFNQGELALVDQLRRGSCGFRRGGGRGHGHRGGGRG